MSGRHTPHLQQRSGIFHLRWRVPDELRPRVGLMEVKRSLHTYAISQARLLAAIYVPRLRRVAQMADAENLSREETRSLILSCFIDLRSSIEGGYLPSTNQPEIEIAEQAGLASEYIRETELSIASRSFSDTIRTTAANLCSNHKWPFEKLSEGCQHDLLEGVARAMIEQQRLFIQRLGDRLTPFVPADQLFRNEIFATVCSPLASPATATFLGPSVKEAVAAYLNHGRSRWTAKTHAGRARQLRYLEEHFGPDTPLAAIDTPNIRAYRDAIRKLRSNHHRNGAQTFATKQTDNEKHQIGPKTASLLFEGVKALFRWATDVEGYLPSNPAENVRIEAPKKVKGGKARRPFSKNELQTLFLQPLFTGCASANRRFQPGRLIIRDDYFWITLLGFYSGARLGEIVQLHLQDIHLTDATPHLEITEGNSGPAGSTNAKHVKSAAGTVSEGTQAPAAALRDRRRQGIMNDSPQYALPLIEHEHRGVSVPQRAKDGYVNATAMCKAAGKQWSDYNRIGPTRAFFTELSSELGLPITELIQSVSGGIPTLQGTWVHPYVAINLGQWLSPQFSVQVSKWVTEWIAGGPQIVERMPYHLRRYVANMSAVPRTHFSVLQEMTYSLIAPLESQGYAIPDTMIPDISQGKMFAGWLRKEKGLDPSTFPTYSHRYEDGRVVQARLYPNELLADFRKHFQEVWLPQRCRDYFAERDAKALPYLPALLGGGAPSPKLLPKL